MKKLLKTSIICFALAMGLAILSLSLGSANPDKWKEVNATILRNQGFHETPIAKTVTMTIDECKKLEVHSSSDIVTIAYGSSEELIIDYYEEYEGQGIASYHDGKLRIDRQYKFMLVSPFSFNNDKRNVTITLPASFAPTDIKLSVSSGSITSNGLKMLDAELRVSNGTMKLEDCSFDESELKVSSGTMSLKNCELGESELNTSNGTMVLDNCKLGSTEVKISSGIATIKGSTIGGSLYTKASSGEIVVSGCEVSGKVTARVSSGTISFDGISQANDYDLKVSSGKINITALPFNQDEISISSRISSGTFRLNGHKIHDLTAPNHVMCNIKVNISSGEINITTK